MESCQIPENILQNMTTLQLLKTCLDYPLYGDIFLFDNYGVGFNNPVMRFNGLQEFLDLLVNDSTITWDDIEHEMFSSKSGDWIDHFVVYSDLKF